MYPPKEGHGRARNRWSSGDWLKWQRGLSSPATDATKTETRPCEETTPSRGADEDGRESPPEHCGSPE